MENASKALIIAGAILLAILLISLGIMIFNQAQDTVNNSGMSQAEITAFNNKFLKYEGKGKTGSEVKALVNEAMVSNAEDNNAHRKIGIALVYNNGKWKANLLTSANNKVDTTSIKESNSYNIKMSYYKSNSNDSRKDTAIEGCIYSIRIIEAQ